MAHGRATTAVDQEAGLGALSSPKPGLPASCAALPCRRRFLPLLALVIAALLTARMPPLAAQPAGDVDLRLVLAVDASGSVSPTRFDLQKSGYAAAFRHPRVLNAIRSGVRGAIAVTMMQWTGPAMQVQVTPWMRIADETTMLAVADAIEAAPRQLFGGGTSISGAIDRSLELLTQSPYQALRSVIDISGDGGNNRGRPASVARDEAIATGVVINGLPILELDPTLDQHYLNNVIGGPNAFMVPAHSFAEFADAILKKLILEIAGLGPPAPERVGQTRKACHLC